MLRISENVGNAPRRSWRPMGLGAAILGLLLLTTTACEEISDPFIDVGTVLLTVTDRTLVPQGTTDTELRIQAAEWTLEEAELFLDDEPTIGRDLRFGEECKFIDTAFSGSVSDDKCAGGIVLGVRDGTPMGANVRLKFGLTMHRGRPRALNPTEDADGDELPNAADKCPYVTDNQEDVNENGIGDACEVNGIPDTDGDGFADGTDNCLWDTNPGQEDTAGLSVDGGVPDGIGDACTEEIATVMDESGETSIDLTLSVGEIPDLATNLALLVVDFQGRESVECNWGAMTCRLDSTKIRACVTDGTPACPETN